MSPFIGHIIPLFSPVGGRQANAEAHDRELEQDLSRCLQLGDPGGAEFPEDSFMRSISASILRQ